MTPAPRFRFSAEGMPRRGPITFDQTPDGTVTLQPGDAPTWQQYVTDFDTALGTVRQNLANLKAMGPDVQRLAPAMRPEWQKLVADGEGYLARLVSLQGMRDSVASWFSGLVSDVTGAYQGAVDFVSEDVIAPVASVFNGVRGAQQLGIFPLIIAGIGAAGFAAVVYAAIEWGHAHDAFVQRFSQIDQIAQAAIAKGADPQTAYAQATQTVTAGTPAAGGGLLETLGKNAIWAAAIIAGLVWVLPRLLPSSSSR